MIINTEQIKSVLNSNFTSPQITEEIGLKTRNIINYRNGSTDFDSMSLKSLSGLQQFYNNHKGDKLEADIKITGIRKAVGAFNSWQGAARVYFDPTDMRVWTNIYNSPGEEDHYDDPAITQIAQKATTRMDERDDRITMRQIREAVAVVISRKG